jgi:hypothetical protein
MSSQKRVLAIHRAAMRNHAAKLDEEDDQEHWRGSKATDIVSFNAGAELHFVEWLTKKIRRSKTRSVGVGWAISNAAYELDVSVATIKRYLIKHTADAAPFKSDSKNIRLRSHPKSR